MLLTALGEPISRILTGSRSGGGGSATGTVAVAVSVAGGIGKEVFRHQRFVFLRLMLPIGNKIILS